MKILAFTDVHGKQSMLDKLKAKIKKHKPDLLVCTGDLTVFEHNLKSILKKINAFKVLTLMLHGNHEDERTMRKLCKKLQYVYFIHNETFIKDDIHFFAYGGGGFSMTDKRFEEAAKTFALALPKHTKHVLLTHAPPYNTKLDLIGSNHYGSKSIKDYIDKYQPTLFVCGHFHENFHVTTKRKKTKLVNPGPDGEIITV